MFADLKNARSAAIIDVCANWLIELEGVEYPEHLTLIMRWDALGGEARSASHRFANDDHPLCAVLPAPGRAFPAR